MKFFAILAGLALFSVQSLHVRSAGEQHQGITDAWNNFWGSFSENQNQNSNEPPKPENQGQSGQQTSGPQAPNFSQPPASS